MRAEATKLLQALTPRDFVVVLDERGAQCTSYDMAHILAQAGVTLLRVFKVEQLC